MSDESARARARAYLRESARVKEALAERSLDEILAAAALLARCLRSGGKVMFCGNGGSAADAQHLAAELTNRLDHTFDRPALAALALTVDSSFLTAHSNDYGFATVFSRQIEALGKPGDLLVAISTSGSSVNLVRAVEACRARDIATLGLLGGTGGALEPLVDLALVVPSASTQHIQESHITVGHLLCELVERELFAGRPG